MTSFIQTSSSTMSGEYESSDFSSKSKTQKRDSSALETFEGNGSDAGDLGDDKSKNRGNYRCSKCNLPKKGHVCPYQPRYKRKDAAAEDGGMVDIEIQTEIDPEMTVRTLNLASQGSPESYHIAIMSTYTKHFGSAFHPRKSDGIQALPLEVTNQSDVLEGVFSSS